MHFHLQGILGDPVHVVGLPCDSPYCVRALEGLQHSLWFSPAETPLGTPLCVACQLLSPRRPLASFQQLTWWCPCSHMGTEAQFRELAGHSLAQQEERGPVGGSCGRCPRGASSTDWVPTSTPPGSAPVSLCSLVGNVAAVITPWAAIFVPKERIPLVGPKVFPGHQFMHRLSSRSSGHLGRGWRVAEKTLCPDGALSVRSSLTP